jgi:mRNA interferase MazF
MTSYNFGDIVLVPFPFTDQTGKKKRPAVVVSSAIYNTTRLDLILMAITSQIKTAPIVGEVAVAEWQTAGLLKASVIKPVLTTIEKGWCCTDSGNWNKLTVQLFNKHWE